MRIGARVACLVFGCGQAPLRGQQPESLRLCRRIGYLGELSRRFSLSAARHPGTIVDRQARWTRLSWIYGRRNWEEQPDFAACSLRSNRRLLKLAMVRPFPLVRKARWIAPELHNSGTVGVRVRLLDQFQHGGVCEAVVQAPQGRGELRVRLADLRNGGRDALAVERNHRLRKFRP